MIKDATIVEQPASSRSGPMQSGALELMDDDDVAISSGSCGMEGLAMLPVQTPVAPSNSVSQVQVLCDSSRPRTPVGIIRSSGSRAIPKPKATTSRSTGGKRTVAQHESCLKIKYICSFPEQYFKALFCVLCFLSRIIFMVCLHF